MTYPTGTQYEISLGERHASITELGAGLRAYGVGGNDVVHGYAAEVPVSGGRGQQLIPWPNRIRDGRYTFGGLPQQLVLSEPPRHNASHGLVRYVPWRLVEHEPARVSLQIEVFPQPGWPGTLRATTTYGLSGDGLRVDVRVDNIGEAPCPFGYGAHPYLSVGESTVDDVELTVPAATRLEVDDRLLPAGLSSVAGTELDLRTASLLGERRLDTAFTDLERTDDGTWTVRLARGERWAELWADESFTWTQVFTGDHKRDVGIAVEPMTCGPDAFNPGPTHAQLIVLDPGDTYRGSWGIDGR